MIKAILDRFADSGPLIRHQITPKEDAGCGSTAWDNRVRTSTDRCPLQQFFDDDYHYLQKTLDAGMDDLDVTAIIEWADYGKWPIGLFYASRRIVGRQIGMNQGSLDCDVRNGAREEEYCREMTLEKPHVS